jgi:hypothetical protein
MTHDELVVLTVEQFKRSLDLEVALDRVPMTEEERDALREDVLLNEHIRLILAEERENIMQNLKGLAMFAQSEGVRHSALKDYAKVVYPSRFADKPTRHEHSGPDGGPIPVQIIDDVPVERAP